MTKKMWKHPRMIVLVRNQPEEAVLEDCKTASVGGPESDCYLARGVAYCYNQGGS